MYYLISKRFDEAEKLLKSVKSTDTKSFFGEINLISLCKELKFYGKEDVLRYLLEKKIFEEFSRKILYSYLIGLNCKFLLMVNEIFRRIFRLKM